MLAKILHKLYEGEVLSHDDKTLTLEHFISTEKQDEDGDIMRADGMQQRGKVVVLQQHGKDPKNGNEPIAKCKGIRYGLHPKSGNPGLIATTQFYDGSNLTPPDHTGQKLYEKARDGYTPNWSIGWLPSDEKGANVPIKGGMDRKKWRLHEYSLVGVGANDEATCADEYKCKSLSDYHNVFTVRHEETGIDFPEWRVVLKGDKLTVQEKSFLDFFDEKDFLDNTEEVKFAIGAEMFCANGQCELVGEGKPFPNEHSCRLVQPKDGAKTRRKNGAQKHEGKSYDVIYQEQNGKFVQQAYRYPKDTWTSAEASAHCKSHKGSFTAAKSLEKTEELGDDETTVMTQARIAHRAMHIAHTAMMHRMKHEAIKCAKTEGGMADSLGDGTDLGNDALNEYRGLVEDHVEKYIKAAQANNANPEFDEDDANIDDSTKDFVQASLRVHHDALKTVHKALIHEIHKHKDKPDVNARVAAKNLLDEHHKMALPHAMKYIKAHYEAAKAGHKFLDKGGPGSGRHPEGGHEEDGHDEIKPTSGIVDKYHEAIKKADAESKKNAQTYLEHKLNVIHQSLNDGEFDKKEAQRRAGLVYQEAIDRANGKKSYSKSIEEQTEMRIACDSLRDLFDGMHQEAWTVANDDEKDTITEEVLAGLILGEFSELALPYLTEFISIIRGPDNDGDEDTEEEDNPGEHLTKKDLDVILNKPHNIEVAVDLNGMEKILTGIFEKAIAQIPQGDKGKGRNQNTGKDLYVQALEGVQFKIGQK